MSKRRIMPDGHWDWSMPVTLSQGWRLGDLIVVGGQISADAKGRTVGGDIETQTRNIMEFIGRVLHEAGADFADVVKQNVYYVVDDQSPPADEIVRRIDAVQAEYLSAPGPVTTETPVSGLAYEGLLLEIDAFAVVGADKRPLMPEGHWSRSKRHRLRARLAGGRLGLRRRPALAQRRWLAQGCRRHRSPDPQLLQRHGRRSRRSRRLDERPLAPQHLLPARDHGRRRDRVLGGADTGCAWSTCRIRGPPERGSGSRISPIEGELIQLEGVAHLGQERRRIMPAGHWDWSMPVPFSQGWRVGNVVFAGGQISADRKGRTVGPGDIARQTENVFESLIAVLNEAGAEMSDVVKLNTYYQYDDNGESPTAYWEKMTEVRRRYFPPLGPAATAVRVDGYAFEDLLIEIEAIAVVEG